MWEALIDFQRMTVCLNALEELLYWLAKTDQYEGWILIFFFHDKKMKDKLDRSIIKLEIKRIPIRIIILKQI